MTAPSPRPGIMEISAYVGGQSKLSGQDKVIKLSSNEGALGASPKAMEVFRAQAAQLPRYPDGGCWELRQALAARWGLNADNIVCGAGSDELLGLLVRAYAGPGDEVLYPEHGFLMYAISAHACGATPVTAPEVELTASVDTLLAAVTPRTRIVFLANPSNPTGTYLSTDEVKRLRAGLREDIVLVIDAAYAEFVSRNDYSAGAELVETTGNTVMTRTFSKIFGMGGIRLGWAYCPPAIADVLNRVRSPFNVSLPAQAAGVAALEDRAFFDLTRQHNDYWLPWVSAKLTALGLGVNPSVANFLLVRFPSAPGRDSAAADAFLREKGIIVRAMNGYKLGEYLRITIGNGEENQTLVAALTDFVASGR